MTTNQQKRFALLAVSPVTGALRVASWHPTERGANVSRTAKRRRYPNTTFVLYAAENVPAALAEGV